MFEESEVRRDMESVFSIQRSVVEGVLEQFHAGNKHLSCFFAH